MFDKFVNKYGYDKLLHFAFGAVICFIITNIINIQDSVVSFNTIWATLVAIVITMGLEYIKEYTIDKEPNKKDIIATFIGACVPFITNLIGILFYVTSN